MSGATSARKGPMVRKMAVHARLRPQTLPPPPSEDQLWAGLEAAVLAVQQATPTTLSLEGLYQAVETLCQDGGAAALYSRLTVLLGDHAARAVASLAAATSSPPPAFLDTFGRAWRAYTSQLTLTRHMFLHLDQAYAQRQPGTPPLYDAGLAAFRRQLGAHPGVTRSAVEGLLHLVLTDRDGGAVDRALAASVLRALAGLGVYEEAFQRPFLEATLAYYTAEGARLAQAQPVPAYLQHVERRLGEEAARCDAYLGSGTRGLLIACVEASLLEDHMASLLERGLDAMVEEGRREDLARAYRLCTRIRALDGLRAAFKAHIRRVGGARVTDTAREGELVGDLLTWRARLEGIVEGAFAADDSFALSMKEAFEYVINQRQNKPAELIAKYVDGLMRGGAKGHAGDDLDAALDAVLVLFRYIQGKDVFEAFYKKDLAKRLLLGRSASIDAEQACIARLKAECGAQFTAKLEGMFRDVELSQDVMVGFKAGLGEQGGAGVDAGKDGSGLDLAAATQATAQDMSVSVLTLGFWPSYPADEATLPEPMALAQQAFKEHYLRKHTGRRLAWYNSLGTCVLRANFRAGPKELSLSLFQAAVLMQFEPGCDRLPLEALAAATNIEDRELRRTLQSLACGKERVLLKEPKGREVEDGDIFVYNEGYTSRLFRVRINAIQLRETPEDAARTNDAVMQDRQYQVDAAVVRIMKTRKTLSHKLLMNELMVQLKFPIKASDLKKRIESLIEREYLERDHRDTQIYNYLA